MNIHPINKAVYATLVAFLFSNSVVYAADAFNPESQWMFGDWNGQRTELQKKVMTLALAILVKWRLCSMQKNHQQGAKQPQPFGQRAVRSILGAKTSFFIKILPQTAFGLSKSVILCYYGERSICPAAHSTPGRKDHGSIIIHSRPF